MIVEGWAPRRRPRGDDHRGRAVDPGPPRASDRAARAGRPAARPVHRPDAPTSSPTSTSGSTCGSSSATCRRSAFRRLCRAEYLNFLRIREWQDVVGAAARDVQAPRHRHERPGRRSARRRDAPGAEAQGRAQGSTVAPGSMTGAGSTCARPGTATRSTSRCSPGCCRRSACRRPPRSRRRAVKGRGDRCRPRGPRSRRATSTSARAGRASRSSPARPRQEAAGLGDGRRARRDLAPVGPRRREDPARVGRGPRRAPGQAHLLRAALVEQAGRGAGDREGAAVRRADRRRPQACCTPRSTRRQARELFIRHALVQGEWTTHHPSTPTTARLLDEAAELEARSRQRGLVVDDDALFAFYDERVPASVVSGAALRPVVEVRAPRGPRPADLHPRPARPRGRRGLGRGLPAGVGPGRPHAPAHLPVPARDGRRRRHRAHPHLGAQPRGARRFRLDGPRSARRARRPRPSAPCPSRCASQLVPAPDVARGVVAWIRENTPAWERHHPGRRHGRVLRAGLHRAVKALRDVDVPTTPGTDEQPSRPSADDVPGLRGARAGAVRAGGGARRVQGPRRAAATARRASQAAVRSAVKGAVGRRLRGSRGPAAGAEEARTRARASTGPKGPSTSGRHTPRRGPAVRAPVVPSPFRGRALPRGGWLAGVWRWGRCRAGGLVGVVAGSRLGSPRGPPACPTAGAPGPGATTPAGGMVVRGYPALVEESLRR